jgi:hypothetical protein
LLFAARTFWQRRGRRLGFLFDGKTLKGWRVAAKPEDAAKNYWTVQNNAIVCDCAAGSSTTMWLLSERTFADFDLKLKVRSFRESGGNSGCRYAAATTWSPTGSTGRRSTYIPGTIPHGPDLR